MSSLTVPTSSDIAMNQSRPKRPCFRCEDCDIIFTKFKRLEIHRKTHCMKRLKNSPSSTICTGASMNTNLPSSGAHRGEVTSQVTHPLFEKFHLATTVKRSFLEASLKTAVDAQYIINLHKVAQQQTQMAFKELDQILNWERTLGDSASPEEQRRVSAARVQALIRAEEAYIMEQHSKMAVKQALSRQKDSIEAAVMATSHEQAALVAALRVLKVPAGMQHANAPVETSFTPDKESIMETPKQKADEIFADAISKLSPEKRLLCTPESPKGFVEQKPGNT